MIPVPIKTPFIGIVLTADGYQKVRGMLPTPSYLSYRYSKAYQAEQTPDIVLIYAIEGYITSPAQYYWISTIKLRLRAFIPVPFDEVDMFHISSDTEINGIAYQLYELSQAFKADPIIYPKPYYPATPKELYRRLIWYGMRAIHQRCFTKECLIATALKMNRSLHQHGYSQKELFKKTEAAYLYLLERNDQWKRRLSKEQLHQIRSAAAKKTAARKRADTQKRIDDLIKSGDYTKPNGKINKAKLSRALGIHRTTLEKYFKK